jgi:TolB-like protein/Tfp pilus assembly protein PilF
MTFFAELKRRNVLRVGAAYMVAAWLVIQVVETIFPIYALSDASIRIVITILAIGLIPTLIFAWAFELTPEGLKKESEVDRSQSLTPQTGKKLDRVIMVVLALGLAYFAFDKFVLDPQREAAKDEQKATEVEQARQQGRTEALVESYGDQSIAVLAFDDMSPDRDQEYLSDGIAEELLNLLAKIPELRVISRSSAFSFKGKDLELTDIAERLNVAHILEGSVRKSGNRVRITAQLIDARSDTHLWSETYDRTLDDIFAIQDDIAATVVAQLKITLLGDLPRVRETNPEAYALYLQARHLGRQGTAEGFEQGIALLKKVLALEPDYADAWSVLAVIYANQADSGLRPAAEGYALVREAAGKALAISPDHAGAHSSLGWIAMRHDNDLATAARHMERALELDPSNPAMIANTATLLLYLGRLDASIAFGEYVTARDPVNPVGYYNLGFYYLYARRWDEAIASYETALRLSPDFIATHFWLGMAMLFGGEPEAAMTAFTREEGDEELRVRGQALALYALGRQEEHQARLEELITRWGEQRPLTVAYVHAYTGDADAAFLWLEKSVAEGEVGRFEPDNPLFDSLRDDPRWLPLLASIGKSPEQLDAIEFEVTLPQ